MANTVEWLLYLGAAFNVASALADSDVRLVVVGAAVGLLGFGVRRRFKWAWYVAMCSYSATALFGFVLLRGGFDVAGEDRAFLYGMVAAAWVLAAALWQERHEFEVKMEFGKI